MCDQRPNTKQNKLSITWGFNKCLVLALKRKCATWTPGSSVGAFDSGRPARSTPRTSKQCPTFKDKAFKDSNISRKTHMHVTAQIHWDHIAMDENADGVAGNWRITQMQEKEGKHTRTIGQSTRWLTVVSVFYMQRCSLCVAQSRRVQPASRFKLLPRMLSCKAIFHYHCEESRVAQTQ